MNRICVLMVGIAFVTLLGPARAQQQGLAISAGTLLYCTLNEPNFSPATVDIDEPVLCDLGTAQQSAQFLPLGAHLLGHLVDDNQPGHLWGKGSMTLAFDRIDLPDGQLPLLSKVVAVNKYRVTREGTIIGSGHAKRDLVEWTVPVLWPWKALTLPLRGPQPTLKGEVQITLRVMEDLFPAQRSEAQGAHLFSNGSTVASSDLGRPVVANTSAGKNTFGRIGSFRPTLLALRSNTIYAVTDYWLRDDGDLTYKLLSGIEKTIDLAELDWDMTTELNAERGIKVILQDRQQSYW